MRNMSGDGLFEETRTAIEWKEIRVFLHRGGLPGPPHLRLRH